MIPEMHYDWKLFYSHENNVNMNVTHTKPNLLMCIFSALYIVVDPSQEFSVHVT